MPRPTPSVDEAIAELAGKRESLVAQLEELERAIHGLETAKRILTPAEPPANPLRMAVPSEPREPMVALRPELVFAGGRRGERAVPERLGRAVREYIQTVGRVFNIRELRDHLAPQGFSEVETGDILTSLMRQLDASGEVIVVTPGVGRRVAEYASPSVAGSLERGGQSNGQS